ncbi:MAG TPA: metal-sensitive transcriptional regulator [Candidatus Nitrosotalea sp.]|nr:metal-sensitive transcriptional regulator [Candidatus Nitrosotalea sp.]
MAGYAADKAALLRRVGRIEGQVRGIARMVTQDAYCIDVLTQIAAIRSALDQVGLILLQDHVTHCVTDSLRQGETAKVDELVQAVSRFVRS